MSIYIKLTSWYVLPIFVGIVLQMIGLRWQLTILLVLLIFSECYNFSKLLEMYLSTRVAKKRVFVCEMTLWTLFLLVTVPVCLCSSANWFIIGLLLSMGLVYQVLVVLPAGIYTLLTHSISFMATLFPGEVVVNRILLWVFNRRRAWSLVSVALTIITIVLPLVIINPPFLICREIARVLGFFTALFCQVLPLAISASPDEEPKFGDFWINSHYYMSGFSLIVIILYSFL